MKTAVAYLNKQSPVTLAVSAVIVIGVVYYLTGRTIGKVADIAGGAISGDNAITRNQQNFSGESTDAYVDKGILGTIGAATNAASGGILASAGETIGGWVFDIFGPKPPDFGQTTRK